MYDIYQFLNVCALITIVWIICDLSISLFVIAINLFLTALWFVPFMAWCILSSIFTEWKEHIRIMGLTQPHDDNIYIPEGTYKIYKKD